VTADKPPLAVSVRHEVRSPRTLSVFDSAPPPHMSPSLLGWVWSMVRDHDLEGCVLANPGGSRFKTVYQAATMNDDLLLDVVDPILQHPSCAGPAGRLCHPEQAPGTRRCPSANPHGVLIGFRRRLL
jgi:hypothetical protein